MDADDLEWDDAKNVANAAKHSVTFERARLAFADPFAVGVLDDRVRYGEQRFVLIGMAEGALIFVAHAERGDRVRIISARR